MAEREPGTSESDLVGRVSSLNRSVFMVAALAIFLGTLGAFGLGLALFTARNVDALREERSELLARVSRLEARVATGVERDDDALAETLRGELGEAIRRTRRSLEDLPAGLAALEDELDALGKDVDALLDRELAVTAIDGLSSLGQEQLLPLGRHLACFLVHPSEGTRQGSGCDLRFDPASGSWTLYARSSECRAACIDWR